MDYSKPTRPAIKPTEYDATKAAYQRNIKMATIGYDKLKQKQAELLAVQARNKAKRVQVKVKVTAPVDPAKLVEKDTSLRPRMNWNKVAMAIFSKKEGDQLAPVEDPGKGRRGSDGSRRGSRDSMGSHDAADKKLAEKRVSPKLFDLVTRLSQRRESVARISSKPKKRSEKVEQSLQYGLHRREMAASVDDIHTVKDCRYLRLRSSEQGLEKSPFDIKEIFDKKE
ncbi:uncharacterized protein LOC134816320 [Bolinopsis microptera]|uniref:uncharacterized protein LOC134816320 n=1 Tax=Bolinopsis microptera TaxID=2820187 RepID=UPI00307AA839